MKLGQFAIVKLNKLTSTARDSCNKLYDGGNLWFCYKGVELLAELVSGARKHGYDIELGAVRPVRRRVMPKKRR